MSFEAWLAFAAASTVLLVIPGPTILLVVSYAWRVYTHRNVDPASDDNVRDLPLL